MTFYRTDLGCKISDLIISGATCNVRVMCEVWGSFAPFPMALAGGVIGILESKVP
jgi:hypothetical protein